MSFCFSAFDPLAVRWEDQDDSVAVYRKNRVLLCVFQSRNVAVLGFISQDLLFKSKGKRIGNLQSALRLRGEFCLQIEPINIFSQQKYATTKYSVLNV